MADELYRELGCARCSVELEHCAGKGRPRKNCEPCGTPPTALPAAHRLCARCGGSFEASPKQKFCSAWCREGTKQTRDEYLAACKAISTKYRCEHCGVGFRTSLGGANKKKGYLPRWCSMACRTRQAEARQEAQRQASEQAGQRTLAVRSLLRCLKRVAAALTTYETACAHCHRVFASKRRGMRYCGKACAAARSRSTPAAKDIKRAHRKAYKMRKRCATVEVFRDVDVLNRDNWTCQICGVATPKRLRGSYKNNAPEVDHIVAIARGGAHASWNCQCACRRCNLAKSDGAARGQIALFGAVYSPA